MAIDAVFPAVSELVMLFAGALAAGAFGPNGVDVSSATTSARGRGVPRLALAGTLGYLAGALIGWAIGRYGGRPLLEHHGRWFHLSPKNLDRAERWFERWGNLGVALGRITPIVRSFVSIPAGVFEMPLAAVHVAHARRLRDLGVRLCGRRLRRSARATTTSTTPSATSEYAIVAVLSCFSRRTWCIGGDLGLK